MKKMIAVFVMVVLSAISCPAVSFAAQTGVGLTAASISTQASAIDETEPNDDFDQANAITVNQVVYGRYNKSGVDDSYRIVLPESGLVTVTFANDKYFKAMFGCDFYLYVFDQYYDQVTKIRAYGESTRPVSETIKLNKGVNYIKFSHDNWTNSPNENHPYHFKLAYSVSAPTVTKMTAAKKAFKAKWTKKTGALKYQMRYSTSKNMAKAKTINISNKKSSKKITRLKSKKKYWIQVRVAKKIGDEIYWSPWSGKKSVKTK